MFWFTLCLILTAAIAALCVWRLYLDQGWRRDLRYFNRHGKNRPSENRETQDAAKPLSGAKPNFNSSRAETREADESRAVYERTVEKLRELSPKRYRRLKPEIPPGHHHDSLPIFSVQPQQTSETQQETQQNGEHGFQTASDTSADAPAPPPEIITEDEINRSRRKTVQEILEEEYARIRESEAAAAEKESGNDGAAAETPHPPAPDAPVIKPDEIVRFKRKTVQEILEEENALIRESEAAEKNAEAQDPPPQPPPPDAPVITDTELGTASNASR
ncbi:hypothetical protein [Kingella potus]|uniref:hypothetical protein n=1 Tax=Kingella potus TaxID=265175 RepID=UPI001FD5C1AD|nr:hypothetical protein [Kingella potus]UOO99956.1 hypothetical protein LVJ84_07860 [Kingella potus]